ncbi:hypothetical protein OUZ56_007536 [Daphnia magna]|uniref:Uncharacterized protein n=1 Tax=Daphnia magna TaxID=35525 RepID=A0ABR0AAE4_9CRUS|nr:hypothetical protein OUZ56_007536 [Daphnia magna]
MHPKGLRRACCVSSTDVYPIGLIREGMRPELSHTEHAHLYDSFTTILLRLRSLLVADIVMMMMKEVVSLFDFSCGHQLTADVVVGRKS